MTTDIQRAGFDRLFLGISNELWYTSDAASFELIEQFVSQGIEDKVDPVLLTQSMLTLHFRLEKFIGMVLNLRDRKENHILIFGQINKWISTYLKNNRPADILQTRNYSLEYYLAALLSTNDEGNLVENHKKLGSIGFSEEDLIIIYLRSGVPYYGKTDRLIEEDSELHPYAKYIGERIEKEESAKRGLLGVFKKKQKSTLSMVLGNVSDNKTGVIKFLFVYQPKAIMGHLDKFMFSANSNPRILNMKGISTMLEMDFDGLHAVINRGSTLISDRANQLQLVYMLCQRLPEVYEEKMLKSFEYETAQMISALDYDNYYYAPYAGKKPFLVTYINYLHQKNEQKAYEKLKTIVIRLKKMPPMLMKLAVNTFPDQAAEILMLCLGMTYGSYGKEYHTKLFECFSKVDFGKYKDELLAHLTQSKSKGERYEGARALIKYADELKDKSVELLSGKVIGQRLIGALMLSHIDDPEIKKVLAKAIDTERNDETRNIMLESTMDDSGTRTMTKSEVLEMINLAEKRKKLSKWSEKWIEEEKMPAMYWTDAEKVDSLGVRFLMYRMKQVGGISSDVEAKMMLNNIDEERSEKFALALLQGFVDSNANSKIKYYLTLCGLLGGDGVLNKLHALFRKSITDKRVKMAEYILGAIAMVGSDKSLRVLEVISRKYASKKPKLSATAIVSLDIAAAELNITKDQLADRIIPNFDFDGIYKEFDVEGETYRAFIGSEFKLVYYNEANKMRKSLPPKTDKETKKEFTAIAKEVRDVVKSQSDRLERYMINGRRWKALNWKEFFFGNPIMFVYAMKLLWIVEDEEGNFKTVFYCDEDAEIFDFEDEEVEINDTDKISILHPLAIDVDHRKEWTAKVYEDEIDTIFPIMDRPIFEKNEKEMHKVRSYEFNKKEIPKGADFVAPQLVKRGWIKSTGDGGRLEFVKNAGDGILRAYASIEGPAVWYQGGTAEAMIHEVYFYGKGWKDGYKIKDVSPIFYSEVMADLDFLIKAL